MWLAGSASPPAPLPRSSRIGKIVAVYASPKSVIFSFREILICCDLGQEKTSGGFLE
jgi:hypothetical protein